MTILKFSDGRRIKITHSLTHRGKAGGYLAVASLEKPHVDQDFIWVELQRSRRKGEKKDNIGFSLNDREALILADSIIYNVVRRMRRRNVL